MGCGGSKVDHLPPVACCKERKHLIREASEQRYRLASAHRAYFRSLHSIGDALQRFVDEEVSVGPAPPSPVLTIPSSDGKNRKSSDSNNSRSLSLSGSGSGSGHLHLSSDDSHVVVSDSDSDSESEPNVNGSHHSHPPSSSPPPFPMAPPNYYYQNYMRSSSTAIPSVIYEPQGYYFGGVPEEEPRPPTPTPPPPEDSAWSFFNPFSSSYGDLHSGYGYGYGYSSYGAGSELSSPDSSKVREREGIPDLEDETDTELVKEPIATGKKFGKEENLRGEGSTSSARPAGAERADTKNKSSTEESNSTSVVVEDGAEEEEEEKVEEGLKRRRKKGVSFEVETSPGGSIESLHTSSRSTLSSLQSRDIREVVEEIKDQFVAASELGKKVGTVLEVGKVRYRPKNPILKAISCRVLDAVSPSTLAPSHRQNASKNAMPIPPYPEEDGMKSGSLSSTLEKLYIWEKKLYNEVKDKEKLHLLYEKQCKRLRILDDRGAETSKIDATQTLKKELETKHSVATKAVEFISWRIHKLRDEELQPQIIELFHRSMSLWTGIMKCHKKQFQIIVESKRSSLIKKTGVRRNSSLRATWELEQELLNWCVCFHNWINTQRAYVKALNGWLLQCLLDEPEETPDGIAPFSPSRIGAPPIFIVSNDWCGVLQRISEVQVTNAMRNFANTVHKLWESQNEERKQKLKSEYMLRDFELKLKSLQVNMDSLDKNTILLPSGETGGLALDSMKRRLEEERAKYAESIRQLHEAISGSIEMGFIPIFEAIDKFSRDVVKGLEGVRIRADEGSSQR